MGSTNILLVEDNPGDTHLIKQTFEERELPGTVHTTKTGEEALDWIYGREEFTDAPHADVILLDVNLPAISGHTVLEKIQSNPEVKQIPVVIITGSSSETQLIERYKIGANACLTKPTDPDEFADLIEAFAEFWADTVTLPPAADPD